jgi:hypothetical protein
LDESATTGAALELTPDVLEASSPEDPPQAASVPVNAHNKAQRSKLE